MVLLWIKTEFQREKNKRYEVKILKVNDEINHLGLVLSVPKEENELDFKHFYKAEIYLNKVKAECAGFWI